MHLWLTFTICTHFYFRLSSRSSYLYEFRHQYNRQDREWLRGVHTEDIPLVFGKDDLEGEDAQLSKHIQAYYCNFAYTGWVNYTYYINYKNIAESEKLIYLHSIIIAICKSFLIHWYTFRLYTEIGSRTVILNSQIS